MANGFNLLRVKSAVKSHSKMTFNPSVIASMDFGQIVPLMAIELTQGDQFDIKGRYFSRLSPLVRPTYGKFTFRTVAAFVPFYQIADDAEALMTGNTVWEGNSVHQRCIKVGDFVYAFVNASNSLMTSASATDADFVYISGAGVTTYRKFTSLGKYVYKVLCGLGYTLPQNVDFQSTGTWINGFGSYRLNAMPLLCFMKLYNDYMSQSQRYNSSSLTSLLHNIRHGKSVTNKFDATTGLILEGGFVELLSSIKLCYENDYFTSAWQNPNTPLNTLESQAIVEVPENGGMDVIATRLNTAAELDNSSQTGYLNQRALDFLKAFDDWVRRNNYSGSRVVQKIYSRFGIKTDDFRSNYAHIISTDISPISVGDVTSTASTTQATLADYAGKGILSTEKGVSYRSSDFGMLFILGYFTVNPMNAYGFDRMCLRNNPLDFYNPEFDGLGADAIPYAELFTNPLSPTELTPTSDDMVYGFTERYNSYRFIRDKILGEFRQMRPNAPENCWHTGRLLSDVRGNGQMVAQSPSMINMAQYDSEYNRIFSVVSGIDHFYLTCEFEIHAVRPMLSLNQTPRLGEGDTVLPRNGNEIN